MFDLDNEWIDCGKRIAEWLEVSLVIVDLSFESPIDSLLQVIGDPTTYKTIQMITLT